MIRLFVFTLFFAVLRNSFGDNELPKTICFIKEQAGDVFTLSVKSDYVTEFTVTVEGTLENMTSSRPLPFTVESAGRSSFVLVRFERKDKRREWRYDYEPYWQFGARRATTSNDADYAMPFGPGRYVVMQGPGGTFSHNVGSGSENAVDWTVPEGTIVCAARDGRVVGVRQDSNIGGADRSLRGFANFVIIKHSDGTFAEYVHLQKDGVMVNVGDQVTTRQPIGLSGQTGFASKPHLHFDVFQAIDGKRKLSLPLRLKTDHGTFTEFIRGQAY
jgi:murein DD-endopeptidase MepM/ murein hydrolase activator NlpD